MDRIKYINSEKFFAKEFNDGIIVAFKNIGDNSLSYADQIHQMVSKNFGVDLFVSDIMESISDTDIHKDSIKDSLFIYVKDGVSISACGIICSYQNRDSVEIKYNSENVLTIKKKRLTTFWSFLIFVLLCFCGYVIFDGTEPEVYEPDPIELTFENLDTQNVVPIDKVVDPIVDTVIPQYIVEPVDFYKDIDDTDEIIEVMPVVFENNETKHEIIKTPPVETITSVKYPEPDVQSIEDTQRNEQIKKMNKYIKIADKAYGDYADTFDESKAIVALKNYRKALDLNNEYNLIPSETKKIEEKIKVLEIELN